MDRTLSEGSYVTRAATVPRLSVEHPVARSDWVMNSQVEMSWSDVRFDEKWDKAIDRK